MAAQRKELFVGELRVEIKSGAQGRPMDTAFQKAKAQSEASRAIGDVRPFEMMAWVKPKSKEGIVAFRQSEIRAVTYALAKHLGLLDE